MPPKIPPHPQYITNFPKPGRNLRGRCGGDFQRHMDADEIVIQREKRDGVRLVFDLFENAARHVFEAVEFVTASITQYIAAREAQSALRR